MLLAQSHSNLQTNPLSILFRQITGVDSGDGRTKNGARGTVILMYLTFHPEVSAYYVCIIAVSSESDCAGNTEMRSILSNWKGVTSGSLRIRTFIFFGTHAQIKPNLCNGSTYATASDFQSFSCPNWFYAQMGVESVTAEGYSYREGQITRFCLSVQSLNLYRNL